jgi:hypothetical protein
MRTVETPSAAGTGWRGSRLYRMIEALETSPMESLYDRVLRLEQDVSALKRNLPIGSVRLAGTWRHLVHYAPTRRPPFRRDATLDWRYCRS